MCNVLSCNVYCLYTCQDIIRSRYPATIRYVTHSYRFPVRCLHEQHSPLKFFLMEKTCQEMNVRFDSNMFGSIFLFFAFLARLAIELPKSANMTQVHILWA